MVNGAETGTGTLTQGRGQATRAGESHGTRPKRAVAAAMPGRGDLRNPGEDPATRPGGGPR